MTHEPATAGDGPAPEEDVPTREMIRAELVACHGLMADCAGIARDTNEPASARMLAAQTASKLAAASAQAASAIARLADAETHQKLADAKIALSFRPSTRRPTARPAARQNCHSANDYDTNDWRAWRNDDVPERVKSTNNSEPRIWRP